NENKTEHVGRGTPEVTPVEIGSIPERANPVVETGSLRSSDVGGCHVYHSLQGDPLTRVGLFTVLSTVR
ncbi:MAG: hypothetical protein ACYCTX_10650, partial [Thermoplasmataceae archaeon]